MAKETTKVSKSETLTIRLDPKTRFVLDYLSRLKGQTITTVVERAVLAAAAANPIPVEGDYEKDIHWQDLWDVSEGVRALNVAAQPALFPVYEEDRRLAFAREHWPFFYASVRKKLMLNHYVDVLWPRIDEFVQLHDDMKPQDYFAAGRAMQKALEKANIEPPQWPVKKEEPEESKRISRDIDSDIPF